jgi:hypothetical protein
MVAHEPTKRAQALHHGTAVVDGIRYCHCSYLAGAGTPRSTVPPHLRMMLSRVTSFNPRNPPHSCPSTPRGVRHTCSPVHEELVLCLAGAAVSSFDVPAILAVMHSDRSEWLRWSGAASGHSETASEVSQSGTAEVSSRNVPTIRGEQRESDEGASRDCTFTQEVHARNTHVTIEPFAGSHHSLLAGADRDALGVTFFSTMPLA